MKPQTIALTPHVHGVGGMVSFRDKLALGLRQRGLRLTQDLNDPQLNAVLVIGGTRQLGKLRGLKRRGVPIVQRLDGMNWLHRRLKTGFRHWLRAEVGNRLLNLIRTRLAGLIVYQSHFSRDWWQRVYGEVSATNVVIYNAVDLRRYHPEGPHQRPQDHFRLLLVEGSLQGGYEIGLENAIALAARLRGDHGLRVRLAVAGEVASDVRSRFDHQSEAPIDWLGLVRADEIPQIDRSAHLLFSGDLNAACPNSVIEALACGLPVAAFDTGALPELVDGPSGAITPYGGDPWRLDPPDLPALSRQAAIVLQNQAGYRQAARQRAAALFDLDVMVEKYLAVLT
jgi:glycosyltransferase involved in cell wall biosynthesis